MKNRQIHRFLYALRHRFLTINNLVIAAAFIIAASWVWGSLGVMQRNYSLQRNLDRKTQELRLAELETRSLELEGEYYTTHEYLELAVRERLGLSARGEKALIIHADPPPSNPTTTSPIRTQRTIDSPSNFQQWMDFLFSS